MAVDRARLRARAGAGDAGARRALDITDRTSFMLSGAQLGITVTGLVVGYVAEPLIGAGLGELLGGIGIPSGAGVAIGTVAALLFATVVPDGLRRAVPEEPRHRPPRARRPRARAVPLDLPDGVRVAGATVRRLVDPAAADPADRAGPRRRALGDAARPRRDHRRVPAAR